VLTLSVLCDEGEKRGKSINPNEEEGKPISPKRKPSACTLSFVKCALAQEGKRGEYVELFPASAASMGGGKGGKGGLPYLAIFMDCAGTEERRGGRSRAKEADCGICTLHSTKKKKKREEERRKGGMSRADAGGRKNCFVNDLKACRQAHRWKKGKKRRCVDYEGGGGKGTYSTQSRLNQGKRKKSHISSFLIREKGGGKKRSVLEGEGNVFTLPAEVLLGEKRRGPYVQSLNTPSFRRKKKEEYSMAFYRGRTAISATMHATLNLCDAGEKRGSEERGVFIASCVLMSEKRKEKDGGRPTIPEREKSSIESATTRATDRGGGKKKRRGPTKAISISFLSPKKKGKKFFQPGRRETAAG